MLERVLPKKRICLFRLNTQHYKRQLMAFKYFRLANERRLKDNKYMDRGSMSLELDIFPGIRPRSRSLNHFTILLEATSSGYLIKRYIFFCKVHQGKEVEVSEALLNRIFSSPNHPQVRYNKNDK